MTYKYNKDGKITEMKDETGTTKTPRDKLDRLTQYKNGAGKTIKYKYNLDNLADLDHVPQRQRITREYDKDKRLAKVTDWKYGGEVIHLQIQRRQQADLNDLPSLIRQTKTNTSTTKRTK